MARVSDNIFPLGPTVGPQPGVYRSQLGMTLDRYQEVMGLYGGIDMCAFNGINRRTDNHDNQCIDIVSQSQRDNLARFLLQAEQKREEWLGYFLSPKWMVNEEQDVTAGNPFMLDKKYLIQVGYPAMTLIEAGVAISYGTPPFTSLNEPTDPIVLTVTTAVAVSEILVTYPGETVPINPTSKSASGGVVTIRIPRCRLVKPEYNDDRDDAPSYYDTDVFLKTVDIYRSWADPALGVQFVWLDPGCGTADCTTVCQSACHVIAGAMAYDLSTVQVAAATYSGGSWTYARPTYVTKPLSVRFHYISGKQTMTNEIYTVRLAHTLMPRPPCSCDIVKQQWTEDRDVVERTWTSYGRRAGAIEAWMADKDMRIGAGGMFPGMHENRLCPAYAWGWW